ncbi:MAG: hypothetical protein ABEJ93_02800, partial [Candidatus Nanohalobium sp.]
AFSIDMANVWYNATLTAVDQSGLTTTTSENQFIKDEAPSFSIKKPQNQVYGSQTNTWKISTSATDDNPNETLDITVKIDGSQIDSTSITEGENASASFTASDGTHTLDITATESDGDSTTHSVSFDVDTTPPQISIKKPDGPTDSRLNLPLNYTVSDPHLDTGSCKYNIDGGANISISNCGNTTIDFGTVGNHTINVYASDTVGNTGKDTKTVEVDNRNEIWAQDSVSGAILQTFKITLQNSSETLVKTTSDGRIEFYTSKMPFGNVTLTISSNGYQTKIVNFENVDQSFSLGKTYSLKRAGVTFAAYNEQKPSQLLKRNVTVSNSTKSVVLRKWNNLRLSSKCSAAEGTSCVVYNKNVDERMNSDSLQFNFNDPAAGSGGLNYDIIVNGNEVCNDLTGSDQDPTGEYTCSFSARSLNSIKVRAYNPGDGDSYAESEDAVVDYTNGRLPDKQPVEIDYNAWKKFGFPIGDVTFTVSSTGFKSRKYFAVADENSKVNIKAYLLENGAGIYTNMEILDQSQSGVAGAEISVQKLFDNVWRTVSMDYSSDAGGASFYLNPNNQYKVVVNHPSYVGFEGTFNPTNYQYNPLQIVLGDTQQFNLTSKWGSISIRIKPFTDSVQPNASFEYTVSDSEASISSFGLEIYNQENGNLLYEKSVTGSSSGGTITLNATFNKSVLRAETVGWFVKDQERYNYTKNYLVIQPYDAPNTSLYYAVQRFEATTGNITQAFIAVFAALAAGLLTGRQLNRKGGGIIVTLVLAGFTLVGFLNPVILFITMIAVAAALAI